MDELFAIEGAREEAKGWSAKECLEDLVERIDGGCEPRVLMVFWTETTSEGHEKLHYSRAGFRQMGRDQDVGFLGYLELFSKAVRAMCLGRGPWGD